MERSYPTWKDRYPDEVTCVRCLELRAKDDVDRMLWCEECRERARQRATRRGWVAGAVAATFLALWIWISVRPDPDLVLGGWIATVVAAFWIVSKVGREIAYGVERFSNRKATDAAPPTGPPGRDGPSGPDSRRDLHDNEDAQREEKP